MNPFLTRTTSQNWYVPVTILSLILGVMISLSWINVTNRGDRARSLDPDQRARIYSGTLDLQAEYQKQSNEIKKLRDEVTKLQNAMSGQSEQTTVLNEALQESKMLAGLTEVVGPGITITLTDSQVSSSEVAPTDMIIHDIDVLKVVNELWSAGAEAITVNGHRIIGGSNFRCVGPVIHVDSIPIASPVVIRALGDPKTLSGGLNLPLGVLDEIRSVDKDMVKVETFDEHIFPAYTGSTEKRLATIPKSNS